MDKQEVLAIRAYKNASNKLRYAETLESYWVAPYDGGESSDKLTVYGKQLRIYTVALERAAQLRQQHYLDFIRDKKVEEPGHCFWREGMLAVAEDAREKLQHYEMLLNKMLNKEFDEALLSQIVLSSAAPPVIITPNVDKPPMHEPKSALTPPPVSAAERARRKKLRAKQRKEKLAEEKALLDSLGPLTTTYNTIFHISAGEFLSAIKEQKCCQMNALLLYEETILVLGTNEEKVALLNFLLDLFKEGDSVSNKILFSILLRDKEIVVLLEQLLSSREFNITIYELYRFSMIPYDKLLPYLQLGTEIPRGAAYVAHLNERINTLWITFYTIASQRLLSNREQLCLCDLVFRKLAVREQEMLSDYKIEIIKYSSKKERDSFLVRRVPTLIRESFTELSLRILRFFQAGDTHSVFITAFSKFLLSNRREFESAGNNKTNNDLVSSYLSQLETANQKRKEDC